MKSSKFLIIITVLVLVSALFLRITGEGHITVPATFSLPSQSLVTTSANSSSPSASSSTSFPLSPVASSSAPELIINTPQPGAVANSPLIVSGQAKGNWFFEATLPVKLIDGRGNIIASTPGRAQSDWITEALVPFSATLNFITTSTNGYLIISKDNPSGLPQNDASVKIPINF